MTLQVRILTPDQQFWDAPVDEIILPTNSGQMGVPVVDIDGEIITGFDKEKIDKLLKINIIN